MQNKIQMLETKSIMDEKKIETFKKALIAQRNTDLQIIMDEKENELMLRMDLLYLEYDPRKICRLCLQLVEKKEDLTPLFWPLKNHMLLSLIKEATNVEVEKEDGMPSCICAECVEDIRRVDWIKRRMQKSNALIKKFVAYKKNASQNETPQTPELKVKPVQTSSEAESPEVKIEDVFSLENSPTTLFENITIKEEPDFDVESRVELNTTYSKSNVAELNTTYSKSNVHELNTTFSKFNAAELNTTYSKLDVLDLNTTYSIHESPELRTGCRSCSRTFRNPWTMMVHERYCSKRFQCAECGRCFLTSALYKRHRQRMRSCYSAETLRYCSECDISFRWKWRLVFHVLRHNTQVCVCGESIHSDEHLQRHLAKAHPDCLH